MSDRRRNLFVLLAVLGLIAVSAVVVTTKETKLGLDLQGGVQLVYEGKPTKQQPTVTAEALDRALDIMRDRVDSLGVAEPELQRSGENQIDVSLPGVDERRARRAPGRHDGADVLLRLGTEHPRRGLQDQPRVGQRRPAADQRPLQRGQAGVEVRPEHRRQQHDGGALLRVRQGLARADQRRRAGGERGGPQGGSRRPEPHRAGRDPRGARGHRRRAQPGRARARPAPRRGRPVVGHRGQPGPQRRRHQEPGAELRERHRRPADRHDGVQRHRAARRSPRRRARSRSAAPTTPRSTAACRTRSAPRTTSRSGSTTS